MKSTILYVFTLTTMFSSCAQTKKYDSSFIRFHLYGKGEPVFVLSGGPGNDCHQEEDVALKIGEEQLAILLEQRGTGLSMPPKLNTETINLEFYLKDILFVMDSLNITKATLYGHSWGAMYACAFALEYPEKVSALILTGPGFMKMDKDYQDKLFNIRMSKLTDEQRKRFYQLNKTDPEKMTPEQKKEFADIRATFNTYDSSNKEWKFAKIQKGETNFTTQALLLQDLQRIHFDLTRKLASLQIPVSIITCKEDPLAFLTDEYKKFAPATKIYWLNECGHFPMYEQPAIFYELLQKILRQDKGIKNLYYKTGSRDYSDYCFAD